MISWPCFRVADVRYDKGLKYLAWFKRAYAGVILFPGLSTKSAIALSGTGSAYEGMRVCISQVGKDEFEILSARLEAFGRDC